MDWLPTDDVLREWPDLGAVVSSRVAGSGLLLETTTGRAHLKPRPRARIRGEMWVLAELSALGVPVTVPLLTRTGHTHLVTHEHAWFVYRELPGTPFPRVLDDPGQARLVGAACARLGEALATLDVTTAIVEGLPVRTPSAASAGLSVQVIHRDFHAANVLFVGDDVSGVLDFDHLEVGPRVVDLAYLAGSVLAELTSAGHPELFIDRWGTLLEGYCAEVPLTADELRATAALLHEIETDFLAWFAEIGDTENAELTRQILAFTASHSAEITARALAHTV